MQVAYDTLHLLSDGKFHSGTALAQQLKVSRSSIWKGISFLRRLDVPIQAVQGRGYRWACPFELLNKNAILEHCLPSTKNALPRLEVVNMIPSTNDYLIARLSHEIPSGSVCIAEGQTAGKGRMGRAWHSPFGSNLYLSLYWQFSCKLYELSGLSLVVGLAVLNALLQDHELPCDLGIKWPNDIWYQGAKLCGILLESVGKTHIPQSTHTDMVIGIGLNVNMSPKDNLKNQSADLKRVLGYCPSRNQLASHVLNSLVSMLNLFQAQGFQAFSSLWAKYDLLQNKPIQLTTPQRSQLGTARGVNERGELCVQIGNTLQIIRYGEVSVRPGNELLTS